MSRCVIVIAYMLLSIKADLNVLPPKATDGLSMDWEREAKHKSGLVIYGSLVGPILAREPKN